jgi:predicted SAM-dependent methyltransferase
MANEIRLNLGSGIYAKRGWINVDKYVADKDFKEASGKFKYAMFEKGAEFVQADIQKMPFPDNYADWAEAHEVLEHMAITEIIPALQEIYRVLKPGGTFIMTCPNFDGLAIDWLRMTTFPEFNLKQYVEIAQTIYGNQAHNGEFHQVPINPQFINYCITAVGFKEGFVGVYRRNTPVKQLGKFSFPKKLRKKGKTIFRNDTIYVEVKK